MGSLNDSIESISTYLLRVSYPKILLKKSCCLEIWKMINLTNLVLQ